ncbi:MAG: AgmX/PglI C-terminal domain-containing protein [Polyangia bacterium]
MRGVLGRGAGVPLLVGFVLLLAACPKPAAPPAPTVAYLQPSRIGVTVTRAGKSSAVPRPRRIEEGSEVRTPAGTRASLFLDSGAWVLLDGDSVVRVTPDTLQVVSGRAWVDARAGEEVKVAADGDRVQLSAQKAGLAVSVDKQGGAAIYCAAGQVTWRAGDKGGRLQSGLSLLWQGGAAKETAQALWDDWTLGLAEPGPLRPLEPAGVGQLTARRPGEFGAARTPLIVRQHDVRVRIVSDLAITEIEQTFFNPRSEHLEGLYAVRLPEAALLAEFSVGSEDGSSARGIVTASARAGVSGYSDFEGQLEWAGPGRYRGVIRNIQPGKTRTVKLRYIEWLPHISHPDGTRRTFVYPMGQSAAAQAGGAPNLGEFSLEVDVGAAQVGGLSAGLGARTEGNKVVLRGSDFRPRADFVLDLLDAPGRKADTLEAFRSPAVDGARYLLAQPALDPGAPPASLDIALVLDVSAGNDEARLDLSRSAALAVLKLLSPADRIAVVAASSTAATLGREALAPATKARIDELTTALSQQRPAGATNLGAALTRAVEILPRGQGVVIYLGDGRPTVGSLTPRELKEQLTRLGQLPRFYAVAVGADANLELLGALCDTGTRSGVVRIDDRPEAIRAALHLIERAAQPSLTNVRVELGEEVDVVYPEGPVAVEGGDALPIVARLRRDRTGTPKAVTLRGLRDGKPFETRLQLSGRELEDDGDLARRWALARLSRLLQRGAGREAVLDIGTRYGVVTPFTALVAAGRGGEAYSQLVGESDGGAFVPPALRGRAPADTPIALEAGVSTQPVQRLSLEQLYQRALAERQAPARLCYERKAAGRPGLSGRVSVHLKLAPDGVPKDARVSYSTLRAKDVEECIERALLGLKLPVAPDGKPHEIDFALQLNQAEHDDDSTVRCSAASRAYLAVRRALWRERLTSHPGVEGAMTVWREAEARCELRSWLDRRALLDLARPHVGDTANQVDLYHRFEDSPHRDEVQPYLRREILRAVRTEQDVRAAQRGLVLDGGIDPELLAQELGKAKTAEEQIAIVRRFLELSPGALALELRLLGLLEQTGKKEEARRLIEQLRADPGADAAVRQAVGEFLIRSGEGQEGARAFSEIVEYAPYDPWGRRRLGDLLRSHGFFEDAYREYQVLSWLAPEDNGVLLLLADAADGLGRSDEALRLTGRVAEALGAKAAQKGPAAWARALYAVRLARLREEARRRNDQNLLGQLQTRARSDGLVGYAGKMLVALTWAHPDANLELYLSPPGRGVDKANPDGERATLSGAAVGLMAQRYDRVEPGEWRITVRKPAGAQGQGRYSAELTILLDEGTDRETLRRTQVILPANAETEAARFVLRDGKLTPEK